MLDREAGQGSTESAVAPKEREDLRQIPWRMNLGVEPWIIAAAPVLGPIDESVKIYVENTSHTLPSFPHFSLAAGDYAA
ncbi:MAG TPA: hypothetical protein VN880_13760 [Solirubrobacteraceae bacterium]|nr:hypothetical protein [Solirubrobacteraceae bacterium]